MRPGEDVKAAVLSGGRSQVCMEHNLVKALLQVEGRISKNYAGGRSGLPFSPLALVHLVVKTLVKSWTL